MRMIALDTETTGLEIGEGHRIVEIGAVELVNLVATAERFHCYLDPERDIESGAYETHGLSRSFLSDYPVFAEKAGEFLGFIGDDPLIIHNAPFDLAFINMELSRAGLAEIPWRGPSTRCRWRGTGSAAHPQASTPCAAASE